MSLMRWLVLLVAIVAFGLFLNQADAQAGRFWGTVYGPPWNAIEGGPKTKLETALVPGRHVVAVDPRVIPLGSLVTVWPNPHRWRGAFRAEDIGGAIKGNDVDIFDWRYRLRYRDTWSRWVRVHVVRIETRMRVMKRIRKLAVRRMRLREWQQMP